MKLQDLEVNTAYMGRSGQVRLLIRFNADGTRVLYRQLHRGKVKGTKVMPEGETRWVQAHSFAGWSVRPCDKDHTATLRD